MANLPDIQLVPTVETVKRKSLRTRLLIAIQMGLILLGLGFSIYQPGIFLGGMLTDSCSGDSKAYVMWTVWLQYLWPVIMLASALLPAILVMLNRRWRWVLLSLLTGGAVSVIWYILWFPVLMIVGC